jgi:hypothetical protein
MKATQFKEYGEPDVLGLVEVDKPHAGPGGIRIAVRCRIWPGAAASFASPFRVEASAAMRCSA